jgi:hypothetical protein
VIESAGLRVNLLPAIPNSSKTTNEREPNIRRYRRT